MTTIKLLSPSFFRFVATQQRRRRQQRYCRLPFSFFFVGAQKPMVPKRRGKTKKIESDGSFCFIYLSNFLLQRKVVSGFVLLWFHCSKKEEDDNFCHLL